MNRRFTYSLPCSDAALGEAAHEIVGLLAARGGGEPALYAARVAIEELGTNVIKYAYTGPEEGGLEIRLMVEAGIYRLEIEDCGTPFNPLDHPAPDLTLPLEERPIGGLGIHLVRQLMDEVSYERINGRNRVTVIRRLKD